MNKYLFILLLILSIGCKKEIKKVKSNDILFGKWVDVVNYKETLAFNEDKSFQVIPNSKTDSLTLKYSYNILSKDSIYHLEFGYLDNTKNLRSNGFRRFKIEKDTLFIGKVNLKLNNNDSLNYKYYRLE